MLSWCWKIGRALSGSPTACACCAIGVAIDRQSFNLGRLTFGPEVGYRFDLGAKATLEPFVGLKGVWDFARTTETTVGGVPISPDTLHGRLEAGAMYRAPSGVMLRATAAYDGVGSSSYHAVQGQANVIVPLR